LAVSLNRYGTKLTLSGLNGDKSDNCSCSSPIVWIELQTPPASTAFDQSANIAVRLALACPSATQSPLTDHVQEINGPRMPAASPAGQLCATAVPIAIAPVECRSSVRSSWSDS